jgi:UDP-N-acetylmuramoyl-tripeptide--D-alanyl-D-alanine ligase
MWYAQLLSEYFGYSIQTFESLSSWSLDSRQVKSNSCYVAIRGEKVDGHDFIEQAIDNGAKYALVEKKYSKKHPNLILLQVENVLETLQQLAKKLIEYWKPFVIAITGSIGKTSTKEFIYTLIHSSLKVHKTFGNQNTQLTLPLTILNALEPTPYLLLEMGIDRPQELERLIAIAPPDFAVLTQLAHVHVEAFDHFENLAKEKCKIFDHPKTKLAFYLKESPFSDMIHARGKAQKVVCSRSDKTADYFLKGTTSALTLYKNQSPMFSFSPPLEDEKSQVNLLLALAVADRLGVPPEVLQRQISFIQYPEKRWVKILHEGVLYIDDSYNACVESVENALKSLPKTEGRKIVVLAPMVDQGPYREKNHQTIAKLAYDHADILVGFGEEMEAMIPLWRNSKKKWAYFLSYPLLSAFLTKLVRNKDTVLIKGSRKYALERLTRDLINR